MSDARAVTRSAQPPSATVGLLSALHPRLAADRAPALRQGNTRALRQTHQVGKRARPHLHHEARSMYLDGLLGRTQFGRGLLVHPAGDDQRQYFALAWRQGVEPLADLPDPRPSLASDAAPLDSGADGVEQNLIVDRPGQEVGGTALHCLDADVDVSGSGEKDDRQRTAALCQRALQIDPVESGRVDIEYEAAGTLIVFTVHELPSRRERRRAIPGGSEQLFQRGQDG